jgi:hypothetical protein
VKVTTLNCKIKRLGLQQYLQNLHEHPVNTVIASAL